MLTAVTCVTVAATLLVMAAQRARRRPSAQRRDAGDGNADGPFVANGDGGHAGLFGGWFDSGHHGGHDGGGHDGGGHGGDGGGDGGGGH